MEFYFLKSIFSFLVHLISTISVCVILYGVGVSLWIFFRSECGRFFGKHESDKIRYIRVLFGSYLLLGMEFLIAADIIETILQPGLEELALLGGIVIVRTLLSFFLNQEIRELEQKD